jgi:signal transduction histidine kinase
MSEAPTPPSLSPLHAARLRMVGAAFLRQRPRVVGPTALLILAALARSDIPRPQLFALACGLVLMVGLFALEAWQLRAREVSERRLLTSLLLTTVGISAGCLVTGGLGSPLLPLLFAPTVTAFSAFGRARGGALSFGLLVLLVALLALVPAGVPFAPLPLGTHRFLALVATLAAALLLRLSVSALSDAYLRAGTTLERLRESALAEAEGRARTLEAVGAKVAHEIKNPLTAVKGLVGLLARSPPDARAAERLDVVSREVARMEEILHGYLSFSRPLEALTPVPCELGALVADVGAVLEARLAAAQVTWSAEGPAVPLVADPRRLKEALLNLAANALEATPAGGRLTLRWGQDPGGAWLTLEDTGRGMSAETLARVGTPFFTTRAGGTGLGVVLARAVAAQHGGSLTFESQEGRGTRVSLRLPLEASHGEGPPR